MKRTEKIKVFLYSHRIFSLLIVSLAAVLFSRLIFAVIFTAENGHFNAVEFIRSFNQYDSNWYLEIIKEGYHAYPHGHKKADAENWAFFPLMPYTVKIICKILPAGAEITGSLLNTAVFTAALAVGSDYIIMTRKSRLQAVIFILLAALGPYTFYFSALYTESFYIFLIICFFYFMRKEKYILMGISGMLCSAVRNTGIMLVFAAAVYIIQKYTCSDGKKSIKKFFLYAFSDGKFIFGVFLVPLGLFAYMLYLYHLTGDGLAFVHIQTAWGTSDGNLITNFTDAVTSVGTADFYLSLWVIAAAVSMYQLFKEKRFYEAIFGIILIVIPLSVRINSIPRYIIGSFIPFLGWSSMISKLKKGEIAVIITAAILWSGFLYSEWTQAPKWLT